MVLVFYWGKRGGEKIILRFIGKDYVLLIIYIYFYLYLLKVCSILGILFGIGEYNESKIYMNFFFLGFIV